MNSLPFYRERKMIYRQRAIRSIRWSTCFMNESSSWRVGFVKEKGMCVGIAVRSEITKVFFNKKHYESTFFTFIFRDAIKLRSSMAVTSAWSPVSRPILPENPSGTPASFYLPTCPILQPIMGTVIWYCQALMVDF